MQFIPNVLASTKRQDQLMLRSRNVSSRPGNDVIGSRNRENSVGESTFSTSSFLQQHHVIDNRPSCLILRPPPGYQTLNEFIRTKDPLTTRDLLEICHSVSENICAFHQANYALGTINFDNIFVTMKPILKQSKMHNSSTNSTGEDNNTEPDSNSILKQSEQADPNNRLQYQLQTYIPGFSAYRVAESNDVDDYAVDMKEYGLVVKKMLQLYHARLMKSSNYSMNK